MFVSSLWSFLFSPYFARPPLNLLLSLREVDTVKVNASVQSVIQKDSSYHVYVLINSAHNLTYVGSTNNLARRIRQHNGDIKGGAKYTLMKKGEGRWAYHGLISNLNKTTALSIEKKVQIRSRKSKGKTPILRREAAIEGVLSTYEGNVFMYSNLSID